MSTNRVTIVENNLDRYLSNAQASARLLEPDAPLRAGSTLSAGKALQIFEDQVLSRCLDVMARELKKTGESFYHFCTRQTRGAGPRAARQMMIFRLARDA